MTRNVLEAVDKAREFFEVEGFPGDFFSHLEKGLGRMRTDCHSENSGR